MKSQLLKNLALGALLALGLNLHAATKVNEWKFENNAVDTSGSGNNGTWTGTASYTNGIFGGQCAVISSSSAITKTAPAGVPVGATNPWSMNLWVNLSSSGNTSIFAGWGYNATAMWRSLFNLSSKIGFVGYSRDFGTTSTFPVGTWCMVTLTYDGTTVTIYTNGVSIGSAAEALGDQARNSVLLRAGGAGSSWTGFNGLLDEFTIWSGVLAPTQIAYLYSNNQVPLPPSVTAVACNPSSAARGQAVTITAAVTGGMYGVSSVTVDATPLGGSATQALMSDGAGNYTNTLTLGASALGGVQTLVVTAADTQVPADTGTRSVTVTVLAIDTWSGGGADNYWSTAGNWRSSQVPLPFDAIIFSDTAGRTTVDVSGADVSPGSVVFNNTNSNFTLQGANAVASGSLIKSGPGALSINNANTYAGGTTLNAGKLTLGNAGAIGAGALTFNGGTLDSSVASLVNANTNAQNWNGDFTFAGTQNLDLGTGAVTLGGNRQVTVNNNTLTIGGVVSGSYGLTLAGNGTLNLTGNNDYLGATTVNGGALTFTPSSGLWGLGGSKTVAAGAVLNVNLSARSYSTCRAIALNGTLNLSSTAAAPDGSPLSAMTLTGNGTLNISGSGEVEFGAWSGGAANNNDLTGFSGVINIVSGTSGINNQITGSLGAYTLGSSNLDFRVQSGAAFDVRYGKWVANKLSGNGTITKSFAHAGDTVYIGRGNGSSTFDGVIENPTGALGLTKEGAGTLVLTSNHTYTGATTVSGGVLAISGSLANTPTTVAGGVLVGTGTIGGAVSVISGGTLAISTNTSPGATLGTLTLGSTLTFSTGGTNLMRISKNTGATVSDTITGFTTLTYGGALVLANVTSDGHPLALGDTFTLFPQGAGSYSDNFSSFLLPALPAGLSWDPGQLPVSGSITVANSAAAPTFTLGGLVGAQTVSISCLTPGATIHYTTNGTTPTLSSPVYSAPILLPVNATVTIQAFAAAPGYGISSVASATYTLYPAAIWANGDGGSWPVSVNWSNNAVGQGSGIAADFSQLGLSGPAIVTLDSTPTIGNLVFGDLFDSFTWTLNNGSGGPLTLDANTNAPVITVVNQTTTIGATLAGTHGFTKSGDGTLVLAATNSLTGDITVNGGVLRGTTGAYGSASGLCAFGLPSNTRTITVSSNGTLQFDAFGLFGGADVTNVPTLVLNGGTAINASGNNPLNNVILNGGTLTSTADNGVSWGAWNLNGTVTATGSSLIMTSMAPGRGALSMGNYTGATNTTFNVPNVADSLTIACTISDGHDSGAVNPVHPSSLTKTGAGLLTIGGACSYSGSTVVSGGTLMVASSGSLASGPVLVSGGVLGGAGTINGPVTVQGGGTLMVDPAGISMLTVNSSLSLGGNALLQINSDTWASDLVYGMTNVNFGGALTVTNLGSGMPTLGQTFTFFTPSAGAYTGGFSSFHLPPLGAGLSWDVAQLAVNGSITVVTSPPLAPPTLSTYGPLSGGSFPLTFSGPSGQTYKVLASTNVALPLANWIVLTTGTFGGTSVTYTDSSATNAHRFYRIMSP